jgi:glycosidase
VQVWITPIPYQYQGLDQGETGYHGEMPNLIAARLCARFCKCFDRVALQTLQCQHVQHQNIVSIHDVPCFGRALKLNIQCYCGAGYWAEDWTSVDPHYGTEADLQQLLLTAKTKGELLLLHLQLPAASS